MKIGENIRKIREIKGFSQEFMSNQLEISQRQFSRIENNQSDITLSSLNKICGILEVTLVQVLGFDEKIIFQNCETAFGSNQNYYAFSTKERELYEKRIKHLEKEIEFLRSLVKN